MPPSNQTDMRAAAAKFFSAQTFAVAGASSYPQKFGHRIFAWYLQHNLSAIPLNPTCSSVSVRTKQYPTVASPSKLSNPKETSLSVITPPPVTAKLLKEAKESGVAAVWLQPGSFTETEMQYALENFPGAAVGGFDEGTVGGEGWCVLVDGDAAMKAAGRTKTGPASGTVKEGAKASAGGKSSRQVHVQRGETFERPSL